MVNLSASSKAAKVEVSRPLKSSLKIWNCPWSEVRFWGWNIWRWANSAQNPQNYLNKKPQQKYPWWREMWKRQRHILIFQLKQQHERKKPNWREYKTFVANVIVISKSWQEESLAKSSWSKRQKNSSFCGFNFHNKVSIIAKEWSFREHLSKPSISSRKRHRRCGIIWKNWRKILKENAPYDSRDDACSPMKLFLLRMVFLLAFENSRDHTSFGASESKETRVKTGADCKRRKSKKCRIF